ncbi:hypothetical protein BGZ76_011274 [Entomortierella beljakovae]|nr:hypothetical protein BGZ76_011274 [Entomortierella beljakovae]
MGAADSKLAFKKGVFRLFEERFWLLPESVEGVYELVSSQDIRRVREEARENLECLVAKAPANQVLNCICILARIFPFIFESGDMSSWEEQPEEKFISTGERLVRTLLDLMFTPGFTLPTALETRTRVSYVMWYMIDLILFDLSLETGVGSSKPIGTSKELDNNRTDVLRLLLVLFSKSLYTPPTLITTTENRWIDSVISVPDRQVTLALLCSLINSSLKYNPAGFFMPYNHVVFTDQREMLVLMCLQVIVILLDYQVEKPELLEMTESNQNEDDSSGRSRRSSGSPTTPTSADSNRIEIIAKNQYCYYLSRLHREQDFLFLADGIYRIISNPMARFRSYMLETSRTLDLVVILLYFSLEHKHDEDNPHLIYTLIQYEPKIQTMARFTLQRGLDDIHKHRYQKIEAPCAGRPPGDGSPSKSTEGRHRRPNISRQQSNQGNHGELYTTEKKYHDQRKEVSDTLRAHNSGRNSKTGISGSPSMGSAAISFNLAESADHERFTAIPPSFARLDSADSVHTPPSDGGGHDGDVEDEGGPSTIIKNIKDKSTQERTTREKLAVNCKQSSVSGESRDESSCELERQDIDLGNIKPSPNTSKSAAHRRPPLVTRGSTSRYEPITTARDVGQDGFIPTADWVREWMKMLRFEPLLVMLQNIVPEIEQIHATNDHQVLEYIQKDIIPMVQEQLPVTGRPPTMVRKFAWSEIAIWFQIYLWSQVYIGGGGCFGRQGLGTWQETNIKLFPIPAESSHSTNIPSNSMDNVAALTASVANIRIPDLATHSKSTTSASSTVSQSDSGLSFGDKSSLMTEYSGFSSTVTEGASEDNPKSKLVN